MDQSNSDWSPQFNALLASPLGKELIKELTQLSASIYSAAREEKTADTAFGLLKESSGVIKAVEHLQFLAVLPKGEGSQDN